MHYLAIWVGYWKNMTFELSGQLSHRRLGWRILLKERKKEKKWKILYENLNILKKKKKISFSISHTDFKG